MKKNKKEHPLVLIAHPDRDGDSDNLQLLRVTTGPDYTKLDFGYKAPDYYTRGGWVKINRESHLLADGKALRYDLINANHIPYGPDLLHFNSSNEWLYFSLVFQPVPISTKLIDLIEQVNPADTDFNIYNIRLDDASKRMEVFG